MHKALGWGFVLGLALSMGLACGGSSGGGGGAGGGTAVFSEDGGYLGPASYRPCLSNMECSPFESCSVFYYSALYAYTTGICTRGCFDDSDCSGDVCTQTYAGVTGINLRTCQKRCAATPDCRGGLICGDAGVCLVYVPKLAQSKDCRDYVACYYRTGGTVGSLDSTYGIDGTCWTSSVSVADSCTSACKSALPSLKQAYPDAGC